MDLEENPSFEASRWTQIAEDYRLRAQESRLEELQELLDSPLDTDTAKGVTRDLTSTRGKLINGMLAYYNIPADQITQDEHISLEEEPWYVFSYGDSQVKMNLANERLIIFSLNQEHSSTTEEAVFGDLQKMFFLWQDVNNFEAHTAEEETIRQQRAREISQQAENTQRIYNAKAITLWGRPTHTLPVALELLAMPLDTALPLIGIANSRHNGTLDVDNPGEFSPGDKKNKNITWKLGNNRSLVQTVKGESPVVIKY